MLPFHKKIRDELVKYKNSLLVLGRGLGMETLILSLIKHLYDPGQLIFILNSKTATEEYLQFKDSRISQINSKTFSLKERGRIYRQNGGAFFITSQILVCDLLNGCIPHKKVKGFIVLDVDKLGRDNYVHFALNVFFEHIDPDLIDEIFVKGFSSNSGSLARKNLQNQMENLYLNKLLLWPRFREEVKADLNKSTTEVFDIQIPFSKDMQIIADNVKSLMKQTEEKIKNLNKNLEENISFNRLKYNIRGFRVNDFALGDKTKNYLRELKFLSRLMFWLSYYDCVTFYNFLETRKLEIERNTFYKPNWIMTDESEVIFRHAKQRVFQVEFKFRIPSPKRQKTLTQMNRNEQPKLEKEAEIKWILEPNPKWTKIDEIMEEIEQEVSKMSLSFGKNSSTVVIVVNSGKIQREVEHHLSAQKDKKLAWLQRYAERVIKIQVRNRKEKTLRDLSRSLGQKKLNYARSKRTAGDKQRETELKVLDSIPGISSSTQKQDFLMGYPGQKRDVLKDFDELYGEVLCPQDRSYQREVTVIVHPLRNINQIFERHKPSFVIVHSNDLALIRNLEVYGSVNPSISLRVYLLGYNGSFEVEQHMWRCQTERNGTMRLLSMRSTIVIPSVKELIKKDITESQERREEKIASSSRKAGGEVKIRKKGQVIIDTREFRSDLPVGLYNYGFKLVPRSLKIGDYVITEDFCIERKSYSDLVGSLKSGRLDSQVTNMMRKYKRYALLIENPKRCSLFEGSKTKIRLSQTATKIAVLSLNYQYLDILWTFSKESTAQLFDELKKNKEQPRAESPDFDSLLEEESENAVDFLKRLPGITENNYVKVLNNVRDLYELVNSDEQKLQKILGKSNGSTLYDFCRQGENKNNW